MPVTVLAPAQAEDAVTVLCEAFFDYPVMRYVLGARGAYAERLRTLVGFFVTARALREEPVLGVYDPTGRLLAAALVTLPGERIVPDALADRREAVWRELGPDERSRYEAFGAASHQFDMETPHHHLNMIGVRPSHAGRGLARSLLDHIHSLAEADPVSAGVTLSTETSRNLDLYERFGYRRLGYSRVAEGLETWALFRPRASE